MVDVVESLTVNTHHNCEHNPQQTLEDEATNSCEKLAPKFCGFQSAHPLGCHNCEHNPQQTLEDEATNSCEKLAPKFCGFQSAHPLGCHNNIALLGVKTNRWVHTKECYEKVNHLATETSYNLYEDSWRM